MKYTGTIYRPPFEARSLLLQVTSGCSHNQCSFCSMYQEVPFQIETLEQIETDLKEARSNHPYVQRIFLVNGDPFALSAGKLKTIAQKINEILPEVETIAMYASVHNIANKSDEELKELRALKINDLNIGVESGLAEVLECFNKGFTVDEAKGQLRRLQNAGIDYSVNIILGGAGRGKGCQHALANSQLLNEVNPRLIFVGGLHLEPGTKLAEYVRSGTFRESTLRETIEEEAALLRLLDLKDTIFFGLHPSNAVPVYGRLPEDKEDLLAALQDGLAAISNDYLDSAHLKKGPEGNLSLRL